MPGVVYKCSCGHCEDQGVQSHYCDEMSRTIYERTIEHQKQILASKEESPMVEHMAKYHKESQMAPKYKVELVRRFKKPIECLKA